MPDTNGAIYGIVSEEGVVKVGNEVVLLDHATLSVLAKTVTDVYGGYMFNHLDPNKTDYMLFTVDNDGAVPKNAIIKDYVQPIVSASGVLGGNFIGTLDALAPALSGVPVYRSGGTVGTTVGTILARPHGSPHVGGYQSDWGGWNSWSDNTASPPSDACPIPSNPLIRAMKHLAGRTGWMGRPMREEFFDKRAASSLAEAPLVTAASPFTMFFTHKTDAAGPMTYSMANQHNLNRTDPMVRARYTDSLFYPDSSSHFAPDTFFNVCIEATHELRLKWLVENGGVPVVGSKRNVLVTTLTANKWYAITVRVGSFASGTKVDVCDVVAGTVTTYDVEAIVSINTCQGYGSSWATYGEPRRQGFTIHGPHNQAVNNTFNAWNASTCWSWLAFAVGSGYSGPWAQWNRKLSDVEMAMLMQSIYDTGTYRAVPRVVSELMKHVPCLYVPFDEYPNNVPFVTRRGQKAPCMPLGSAYATETPGALSIRRRKVVSYGEGLRIQPIAPPGTAAFTLVGFLYQGVTGGVGTLFSAINNGSTSHSDAASTNTYVVMTLSVASSGRLRLYWRNSADAYNDNYFGSSSALDTVGHHMVAIVFDAYNGLNVKAYVDGTLLATVAVSQQNLESLGFDIDALFFAAQTAVFNGTQQINSSPNYASGSFSVSGIGTLRSAVRLTDFAAFNGCLSAADIAEIHAAYVIAVGPDSHE